MNLTENIMVIGIVLLEEILDPMLLMRLNIISTSIWDSMGSCCSKLLRVVDFWNVILLFVEILCGFCYDFVDKSFKIFAIIFAVIIDLFDKIGKK